jgi:hypothetical protein
MYRIPDTCYSEKHVYELKRLWIQVAIDVLNEIALKEAGSPTRGQALLRGRTLALPKAMNMVITSTLSSLGSLRDALSQKYAALGRWCAHVGAPLLGVDVRDGRVAAVEFKPELFEPLGDDRQTDRFAEPTRLPRRDHAGERGVR